MRLVPAIDLKLRKVKPVQVRSKINEAKLRGFKVTFGCTCEAIHSVDGLRPTRFCRNDPTDHAPRAEPAAGGPPIPELFWLGISWIKLTWAGHVVVRFLCDCTLEQNEQLLVFHWSRLCCDAHRRTTEQACAPIPRAPEERAIPHIRPRWVVL